MVLYINIYNYAIYTGYCGYSSNVLVVCNIIGDYILPIPTTYLLFGKHIGFWFLYIYILYSSMYSFCNY